MSLMLDVARQIIAEAGLRAVGPAYYRRPHYLVSVSVGQAYDSTVLRFSTFQELETEIKRAKMVDARAMLGGENDGGDDL